MRFTGVIFDYSNDKDVIAFLNKLALINESVLGYHYPFYKNILESIGIGEPLYAGLIDETDTICAILPGFIKTINSKRT